jgi:pyruvate-formate lyase-activating enzyme
MKNLKVWKLPWYGKMVPHAVLDILRDCNISCRACYNACPSATPKTLEAITEELENLLRFRRLSSISIVGGEVALHPQLCEIISMVRKRGLHVELVTNGLAVDNAMMEKLADAGLTVIYFHIEQGQKRPDLPANHSFDDINRLRMKKATMAANHGIDVGLTLTVYPNEIDELQSTLSFVLQSPHVNFLLVTMFRDTSTIDSLHGDISTGISGTGSPPPAETRRCLNTLALWIKEQLDFDPFAFIGSNLDPNDPRWLSYLIVATQESDDNYRYQSMQPSILEKALMLYYGWIKKRYPMYIKQDVSQIRAQLLLNGLLTWNLKKYQQLINISKQKNAHISTKRILFQNPAELTENGTLLHCHYCPDAVIKNGELVPVCIADKIDIAD